MKASRILTYHGERNVRELLDTKSFIVPTLLALNEPGRSDFFSSQNTGVSWGEWCSGIIQLSLRDHKGPRIEGVGLALSCSQHSTWRVGEMVVEGTSGLRCSGWIQWARQGSPWHGFGLWCSGWRPVPLCARAHPDSLASYPFTTARVDNALKLHGDNYEKTKVCPQIWSWLRRSKLYPMLV